MSQTTKGYPSRNTNYLPWNISDQDSSSSCTSSGRLMQLCKVHQNRLTCWGGNAQTRQTVRSSFLRGYKYYKSTMSLSQRIITRKLKGQGHQTKSQLIEVQYTQRRFYVFHLTSTDKFYLAQTIAGYSKRTVADRQQGAVLVIRRWQIIVWLHI